MSQMQHKNKALYITICTQYLCNIDVFVTLRKMTIIFNMSVCPSARKKAPLGIFLWNLIVNDAYIQVTLISDRNDGKFYLKANIYLIVNDAYIQVTLISDRNDGKFYLKANIYCSVLGNKDFTYTCSENDIPLGC